MTADDGATLHASDSVVFDAFVRAQSPALLRLAWGLTGDRGAAEDLVQVALERVWTHWPRIRDKQRAGAYARKVTVSRYLTSRRRLWWGESASAVLAEHTVDDGVDALATRDAVAASLSRLPARQRAVLVLRYLDDLSESQAAEAMGCSPGTVKSHTARALAALRGSPDLLDLWTTPSDGGNRDR